MLKFGSVENGNINNLIVNTLKWWKKILEIPKYKLGISLEVLKYEL